LKTIILGALLLATAAALAVAALAGLALLGLGIRGWLHPVDVPAAWTRTLAGIGLLSGSAGAESLCWLAVAGLIRRAHARGTICSRVLEITDEETGIGRAMKFIAVIGLVSALICLPLAAGLRAGFGRPWFGS
jgi:hypothetical protein